MKSRVSTYAGAFGVSIDTSQVVVTCGSPLVDAVRVGVTNYPLFSDLNLYGLNSQTVTRNALFRCEVESNC